MRRDVTDQPLDIARTKTLFSGALAYCFDENDDSQPPLTGGINATTSPS